ncbi:DUF6966 domain-containing protein [Lentzea sp. NPDC004789]
MANDTPPVLATAAGLASELYERALAALVDALGEAGDTHWQTWMREDLATWRAHRRTDHHRGAFGGMGSFNDRALVRDPWVATSIEQLSHLTAATAAAAEQTPDRFLQVAGVFTLGAPRLDQRSCTACGRKSIEEAQIERVAADAWSSWAIPRMVTDGSRVAREPYERFVAARASGLERCVKFGADCPVCGSSQWKHVCEPVF